jgi:signal transduction histidine kinase
LEHCGEAGDVEVLQAVLATETNSWTKKALTKAIKVLTGEALDKPIQLAAEGEDDRIIEEIHAAAVEETTQRLLHEIRPILGRLNLYASQELQNLKESKTSVELTRLGRLVAAIDLLSQAASSPVFAEFDMAALLDQIVTSEATNLSVKVEQAGQKPFLIMGSSTLVGLVAGNGVRNAIEASVSVQAAEPVVVSWGSTDRDHWITVLDRGPGLPVGSHNVFEIGTTTKKDHLGMGLALAKRAALSLNGSLELAPRSPNGARFEFRWPHAI